MNILFCYYGVDTVHKSSVRIQLSKVYRGWETMLLQDVLY